MFKNREIRIKVAKADKPEADASRTDKFPFEDPEIMKEIAVDFLKKAAIIVGVTLVVSTALHTVSEIIIKKTQSADNN